MISSIWSSKLDDYISSENPARNKYINLGRLNLIIGANNTGKSRLLRKLFLSSEKELLVNFKEPSEKLKISIKQVLDNLPKDQEAFFITGEELYCLVDSNVQRYDKLKEHSSKLSEFIAKIFNYSHQASGGTGASNFTKIRRVLDHSLHDSMRRGVKEFISETSFPKRHYIPILRGMRPLDEECDLFAKRTLKDYFHGLKPENFNIVTGFNLYELLARFLLGQPEERDKVRAYERIIGEEFFGGADITLIPEYGKDTVSVKIGEDKQFPIYDLGDGLQQVIIITSAAFLENEKSIYFIEEPEIGLHPGLLRKLALFLLEHTNHQYLVTTHSNHLLDLAELNNQVLVHRLTKKQSGSSSIFYIRECSKDREILSDLGVHASSVYLSNSSIWVEGITDRLYVRSFMEKYIQSLSDEPGKKLLQGFLENYHYSFVEYQGGTLGHWNFDDDDTDELCAIRLCTEAILIADGDIKSKGNRLENLSKQLGNRLLVLEGKEIENTIPEEILIETAIRMFDSKRSTKDELNKDDLRSVRYSDYAISIEGIGYHLDRALGLKGKGKNERRFFADESGTIKDKVKFCRTALDVMSKIEWELTEDIKSMCEYIFAHIKQKNS